MRFHFNVGPFGVSSSGRHEPGPRARDLIREIRRDAHEIKPLRFRGDESKKLRAERRERAREIARSARQARRNGTIYTK